jgi:hypothetical protein
MSRIQRRERTPVSLGTMIRDAQMRASTRSDHPKARLRRGLSYAELYRGTEYQTRTTVAAAATPMSRGRTFVLVGIATMIFTPVLLIGGLVS